MITFFLVLTIHLCIYSSEISVKSFAHFYFILFYLFYFCLFSISWAAPMAYGGSQARGQIGAAAPGLCHSRSNSGSEPHLRPTPQFMAMPDLKPTEQSQGLNLHPHRC